MGLRHEIGEWLGGLGVKAALLVAGCGPGLFIYQIFLWLKSGEWQKFSVESVLRYLDAVPPEIGWKGLQKIIDLLISFPLSLTLICVGLLAFWGCIVGWDELTKH